MFGTTDSGMINQRLFGYNDFGLSNDGGGDGGVSVLSILYIKASSSVIENVLNVSSTQCCFIYTSTC
jgi:hypothetical protein